MIDKEVLAMNNRLERPLGWIRQDPVRFGCCMVVAAMYLILLSTVFSWDATGAMVAFWLSYVCIPPILLVVNGVYASRKTIMQQPRRTLLFPLGCTLLALPVLLTNEMVFYTWSCSHGDSCILIGTRYIAWSNLQQPLMFTAEFAVASFLGFGVVWAVRWMITRRRR